ncbi:IMP dehydrogenase [Haloarcula vallismortis]|uniref:Inosine monophosphate dehydrogenase n=2 Tax=Haloarcula vallismortis TaxID=28442 RepID=M0JTL3_HALVA|nr:hemolysin family protein [Haloarcula vallismortis]EMA11314.1 inosine monophosphate dehydrogenase [Haloarcula vallismortis ATCC 29715]SDW37661.1 IMP dehydrogenase [Haloarcula vallismortis]
MQPVEIAARLLAGVALILANGFFVAIEFALTRARQYTESEFDEPGLRRAWEMTDDLEIYLTSCQVGITASSIAVGIIAEPALAAIFEPYFQSSVLAGVGLGGAIAFLLINLVHLTHGEQTPTYLGVERAKFVCRYGATPLYYFAKAISPIIAVGDGVAKWTLGLFGVEMSGAWLEAEVDSIESRAELRNELSSVLDRGDVPDERREEVLAAFRVGDREVGDVMVPREDIVALSPTADDATNAERIAETPHTRYPLVGETLEDFHGIVYIPALVDEREEQAGSGGLLDGIDLETVASPPMTISPDTTVSDAIDQFQAERQELALVFEDGAVVGLMTVTDLLEEVVGDIQDPMDAAAGVA